MPSLFVISTDERYPLTPGEHVAGRLQSCALTLNEVQASRRQFALRSRGSRWTVCDLGSRNGTSLNAQRLTETPVPLHHGDRISVGETVIRYDVELDPLVPGTELGGVTVAKRRGRSEYGTLYHGRQGALDRDVVVEVLDPDLAGDPEFVSAYQHRARSAGAFEHPAVLTVLDVVAGDKTYTVFELFGGSSLAERWRGDDGLERSAALRALAGLAEALAHVHARGKHHGLLTPASVLVDARQRVKLRGLGEPPGARLRPYSRLATVRGTYASPEEARGEPSGPASDLYSFGLLACRLLSGELPFKARKVEEALALHASPDPLPLAGVDEDLDLLDLLEKLLSKDPALRPTAEVARERIELALARAGEAADAGAHTPPRLPPSARQARGDSARESKRAKGGGGVADSAVARRRSTGKAEAKRDSARAPKRDSARAPQQDSARSPKRDSARAPAQDSARARRTASSAARRAGSDATRQRISDRVAPPEPPYFLYVRLCLVGLGYVLAFSAALLAARLARRLLL
ncbi:MAG: FHA domain-containing protein [Planctomycetes bacterium]|nr:FHA domain-containing protein [Planctomycetota bacterium]